MTIKAAVIGVGNMGKNHARVWASLPGAQLVGVYDQDYGHCQGIASAHRCEASANVRALLDLRPDVVSVCVPTSCHASVTCACLTAGAHVLVEKPIADHVGDAQMMVEWAKRCGKLLMVGHIERYNPAVRELRRALQAGALGHVWQLKARRMGPYYYNGASVLLDLGVHDLDIIEWVTGQRAVQAWAQTVSADGDGKEDLALAFLRFNSAMVASVSVNRLSPIKERTLEALGERGLLALNYISQTMTYYSTALGEEDGQPVYRVPEIVREEPLVAELRAVAAAVRCGGACIPSEGVGEAVSGEEGLRALFLAEKLRESQHVGYVLEIA